jgi:Sel1 repeat
MRKLQPCTNLDELQLSAHAGDARAQYELGLAYEIGPVPNRDLAQAQHWFRKAAEQDYPDAQFKLGVACHRRSRRGFDTTPDEAKVEAYKWYKLAARQGNSKATNQCDLLALYMTLEEITEGNRRVAEFVPVEPSVQDIRLGVCDRPEADDSGRVAAGR